MGVTPKIREEKEKDVKKKNEDIKVSNINDLPIIPDTWEWVCLGEVSSIMDVDHKMPKAVNEGSIYYVSSKDFFEPDGISFEKAKRISEKDFIRLSRRFTPEDGDIIYSRYGTIGKVRKVKTNLKYQISYSLCIIKTVTSLKNNDYIYWLLKSPYLLKQAISNIKSSAVPDLGLKDIKKFKIPIPCYQEQNIIVEELETRFSVIDEIERAVDITINQSYKMRQSILKKAFKGKLVPQDPNDEPAEKLLNSIKKEKANQ